MNAGVLVACVGKAASAIVTTAHTLEDGFTVIGHGSLIGELQTVLVKREMQGALAIDGTSHHAPVVVVDVGDNITLGNQFLGDAARHHYLFNHSALVPVGKEQAALVEHNGITLDGAGVIKCPELAVFGISVYLCHFFLEFFLGSSVTVGSPLIFAESMGATLQEMNAESPPSTGV